RLCPNCAHSVPIATIAVFQRVANSVYLNVSSVVVRRDNSHNKSATSSRLTKKYILLSAKP
ncbi:hypothetical protein, partial [Oleiphilus sp. HI0080]|uniref:hypothetical protein n=1 Tax=Oleiphilus sp. HI0080 TaxID=1822255 RepID=UPI001E45F2F1